MKNCTGIVILAAAFCVAISNLAPVEAGSTDRMKKTLFGKTEDGKEAQLYTLTNKQGAQVSITDFGGTVVSLKVADRNGKLGDVVLGYDAPKDYELGKAYFGGTIGRYGNRIAHGQFTLDGKQYTLAKNDGANHLHGGIRGFNKVLWTAADVSTQDAGSLRLTYLSKDGEEGYPGNLSVQVTFTLTDANELKIDYTASTDKDTVANLTNHSYFNLAGTGTILDHQLTLSAGRFTPVDAGLIPTGELRTVQGTPFDFRTATVIGARINQGDDEQLKLGKGYDHNWILDKTTDIKLSLAAKVSEPTTGRILEVWTTEPAIQFYSGNFLDGSAHGKGGKPYEFRSGFCLETQHYPDSPNHPDFPSTTLKVGTRYNSTTVFKFTAK
jgi:aldose 1-epimerase